MASIPSSVDPAGVALIPTPSPSGAVLSKRPAMDMSVLVCISLESNQPVECPVLEIGKIRGPGFVPLVTNTRTLCAADVAGRV